MYYCKQCKKEVPEKETLILGKFMRHRYTVTENAYPDLGKLSPRRVGCMLVSRTIYCGELEVKDEQD